MADMALLKRPKIWTEKNELNTCFCNSTDVRGIETKKKADLALGGSQMDTDQKNKSSTGYNKFKDMILKPKLLDGFRNYGYNYPSMVQQQVIVALQNGQDVVVQETDPGKIATISLGILQLLDFADHQLQALVLTASLSSAIKIREDMQQLGGSLGVKVCLLNGSIGSQRLDGVDVIVSEINDLRFLFRQRTSLNRIRLIFLNDPDRMHPTLFNSNFHNLPNKDIQYGIFTETVPQGQVWRYFEPKLKQPFFNSETREFQSRGYLQGWEVLITSKEMNQKRRDEITKQLSFKNCVLITTEGWSHGIDFQKVKRVVCYDLITFYPERYLRCMGQFSGGRVTAINFVNKFGMETLFNIQKQYYGEVVFKESTMVDGQAGFSPEEFPTKELPRAAPNIKHIVYDCEEDSWKSSILYDVVSRFFCQKKCVVFLNTFKQIKILSNEMAHSFGDGDFKVLDTLPEFSACEGACMLITTDEGGLGNEPLREMPLIINFDIPLSREVYNHRISCCGEDGSIVHFVTEHDWFKVFHVQSAYKYILTD
ncbi:hypothetical protein AQUCO_01900029v1 [Aquilegia coerulea]|uniref:ATP-dependent RNA helicase n=1 Tax=Aquilegia coerulea TaxID=218851 RepID=A0A2G5DIR9_AQUCA|nr:hypothetical protein AQUCO_01900029v1 [Aquilegia coerulea]